jgi:hypothetical protein
MVLVTPGVALIVFLIVLLIAFLVAYKSEITEFSKTRTSLFLATLAGLGIFITFLFYYSVVGLQQQQQRLSILDETNTVTLAMINGLIDEFKESVRIIPQFAFSLLPLAVISEQYLQGDPCTPDATMQVIALSKKIFTLWQNSMLTSSFIDITPLSLNVNFLQQASSPYLYQQWKWLKINYNLYTQDYGDLLFEYGLTMNEKTPQTFEQTAKKMMRDERYLNLCFR